MLTTAQHDVIREELLSDPLNLGYSQLGHDAAAEVLNLKNRTAYYKIPMGQVLIWSAFTGGLGKLRTAMAAHAFNDPVHAVAEAALGILEIKKEFIDLTPEVTQLFDFLVTNNVLTADDKAAFLARAAEQVSRAEELLHQPVILTGQDIYIARHERDPNFTPPPGQPFELHVLKEMADRTAAELSDVRTALADKIATNTLTEAEAQLLATVTTAAADAAALYASETTTGAPEPAPLV